MPPSNEKAPKLILTRHTSDKKERGRHLRIIMRGVSHHYRACAQPPFGTHSTYQPIELELKELQQSLMMSL